MSFWSSSSSSSSNTSFHHHHHHHRLDDMNNLNLDLLLELSSSSCTTNNSSYYSPPSAANNYNSMEPRVFSCNYCQRKFYSSQALGGHQNAHKLERTLAKKSRELSSMQNFGLVSDHHHHHHHHRSSTTSSFNNNGSNHLARVGSLSHGQAGGGVSYERREFISYGGSDNPIRSSGNVQQEDNIGQLDLSLRL